MEENDLCAKRDFLMHCRDQYLNDKRTLATIDEFDMNYRADQAIWWFTRDSFVHRTINRSLGSGDVQLMNKCRFFIHDLHRQLSYLHSKYYIRDLVQPTKVFYRGTTLSSEDRSQLVVGKLITFNGFVSASVSQDVAMMFGGNVLFQIEVNNRTGLHSVFHQILNMSCFQHEQEILFSIGNVFHVDQIQWCDQKNIWQIKLTLEKDLQHRSNSKDIKIGSGVKRKLLTFFLQRSWPALTTWMRIIS